MDNELKKKMEVELWKAHVFSVFTIAMGAFLVTAILIVNNGVEFLSGGFFLTLLVCFAGATLVVIGIRSWNGLILGEPIRNKYKRLAEEQKIQDAQKIKDWYEALDAMAKEQKR
jgi:hypothetical protein